MRREVRGGLKRDRICLGAAKSAEAVSHRSTLQPVAVTGFATHRNPEDPGPQGRGAAAGSPFAAPFLATLSDALRAAR